MCVKGEVEDYGSRGCWLFKRKEVGHIKETEARISKAYQDGPDTPNVPKGTVAYIYMYVHIHATILYVSRGPCAGAANRVAFSYVHTLNRRRH